MSRMPQNQYDAIVVLAGGVDLKGEIPPFVQKRISAAASISKGNIPIIMAGHWSFLLPYTPPLSEASVMKAYALRSGDISADKVIVEEESADTIGNAYFTKIRILEPHNWHDVLLITSEFHIARSTYIFHKVLGSEYAFTPHAAPSGFTAGELKTKAVLEEKLLNFTKELLRDVPDGDSNAVRQIMNLFPGYGSKPKYTQSDLLEMLDIGVPVVDAYGLTNS
jgi:uncharacterized SAM-binding protein YcdF (DUF218 family)